MGGSKVVVEKSFSDSQEEAPTVVGKKTSAMVGRKLWQRSRRTSATEAEARAEVLAGFTTPSSASSFCKVDDSLDLGAVLLQPVQLFLHACLRSESII
ncbi:hypothetical protein IEQ34_004121 [Dendrobium chrysotoxum]|uniref:Uncharacterized protein n=1 Tax=Dendrobium chrysotoxum TaxID=161865 RepID=A0AAV7HHC0_DENCH|nr:hypothetical protein IEQ34_004121 [Dendrobium chrysotoxum]